MARGMGPGHEVKLWVAWVHLGAPSAHPGHATPPFKVVTPATVFLQLFGNLFGHLLPVTGMDRAD